MDKNALFRKYADEISDLHDKKSKAYGDSFGQTYEKLGIISAVTRISDKYNRLCTLATNPDIDNFGESIDDTLIDLAAYAIMTLIERRNEQCDEEPQVENRVPYDPLNLDMLPDYRTVTCKCSVPRGNGGLAFIYGQEYLSNSDGVVFSDRGEQWCFTPEELKKHFE